MSERGRITLPRQNRPAHPRHNSDLSEFVWTTRHSIGQSGGIPVACVFCDEAPGIHQIFESVNAKTGAKFDSIEAMNAVIS
jgi:hypothetical protein